MYKRSITFVVALVAILWGAATMQAQVNMNRYITLTVQDGVNVSIETSADANGTPLKIVSGSKEYSFVGQTGAPGAQSYLSEGTTMTIYGNIVALNCSGNKTKITALDASNNTMLKSLTCSDNNISTLNVSQLTQLHYLECDKNKLTSLNIEGLSALKNLHIADNQFTTQTLDDIYCALPMRQANENAQVTPAWNARSTYLATVYATDKNNALRKNWTVRYRRNYNDEIEDIIGMYACGYGAIDSTKYITLGVLSGQNIKLDLQAAAENTPVRIVSGGNFKDTVVGTNWLGVTTFPSYGQTMKIYGNIVGFNCSENDTNIYSVDASNNGGLLRLSCINNAITTLSVDNDTLLTALLCHNNKLRSVTTQTNRSLQVLMCGDNPRLDALSLTNNTLLTTIDFSNTAIASLDISNNANLREIYCYGSALTTRALNDLYCSLADRTGQPESGVLQPIFDAASSNRAVVIATNKNNAIAKNWVVQYYDSDTDIPATSGTFNCSGNNFVVTIVAPTNGSVVLLNGTDTITSGSEVGQGTVLTVKATPDNGFLLTSLSANGTEIQNESTITVTEAVTIEAAFSVITSITDADITNVSIYPNPVKEILNVISDEEVVSISVYNSNGVEVASSFGSDRVDMSQLSEGVYIVRIRTNNGVRTISTIKR